MTACRPDCGQCCDPVMLPYSRMEAIFDPSIPLEERQWADRCLTAMPVKEAHLKAPWLIGRLLADRFGNPSSPFFFRCSNFDPATRQCTDYDNRPGMCRGYPWYGGQPRTDAALPPDCSYQADLIQIGPKP